MKGIVVASALALLSLPVQANQFDQLHMIEQQTKQAELNAETERLRQAAAAQARAEAQAAASRRERAAAQQAAAAKAAAQRQAQEQEHKRLRTREESFEDELRAMELEERRLELQAKRAKAARANDYIDAELRESAARTDVIQSDADATRNVTSGAKALLEDTGAAEVNRSKRLFE
jgi:hypothetical protein